VVAEQPPPEPVIERSVAVTAVEADSAGTLFIAGTAETREGVRVYLDDVLVGQAAPSPSGTWLIETQREMPEGTYQIRADQVDRGGQVLVRAEVPFEREIEVAILEPIVESGAATGTQVAGDLPALKTVIIKRGDNLWRISRQIYGRGIRYSTIYEANRDQIRNPRWIFPGQVFILPEGNIVWPE
ncbi:MAG: LysM peptidoglycan-binding domain-containing protein, partial [Alphaproteobacteria bacterium]